MPLLDRCPLVTGFTVLFLYQVHASKQSLLILLFLYINFIYLTRIKALGVLLKLCSPLLILQCLSRKLNFSDLLLKGVLFFLISGFVAASILLFQRLEQLMDTFCFALGGAILYLSFSINHMFVHGYLVAPANLSQYYYATIVCVAQFIFASAYVVLRMKGQYECYGVFTRRPFHQVLSVLYHLLFCLPAILHIIGVSPRVTEQLPMLCAAITNLELMGAVIGRVPRVIDTVEKNIISLKMLLRLHGIQLVIESQWVRLRVPTVLQTYWLCKLGVDILLMAVQEKILDTGENNESVTFYDMDVQSDLVSMNFKGQGHAAPENQMDNGVYFDRGYIVNSTQTVLLKGCDGVIPLLGMTTVLSKLTHYLGLFLALMVGSNNEDDKNMGTMCGILFFVLALQTGLTRLEPSKRLIRLYRNLCLLSTAILHFIHSMVHPVLMNISATRAVPTSKHLRVLSMCVFLLVFPVCLLCYLWTRNTVSPWLLAVTAFSTEVMIKVMISLLIYALFMLDSLHDGFWERLDDYIYYIKGTGNTIEFLFGIFLFCNGAWILLFESGGMIRAVMMCIHAYFNIWMQACEGWKVFMQRRTAVHKINSLPEATEEQLLQHNDVCAICHETLESARITACHHYFHGVCLRKWLYHQDRCPMCHQSIYKQSQVQSPAQNTPPPQPHNHQD